MANLSIKNVPEELIVQLRERAKRNHRSLQGELLTILEGAISPKRLTVEEACHRLRELSLRTGPEAVAIVREDRDRDGRSH